MGCLGLRRRGRRSRTRPQNFLQWFVTEQLEEVSGMETLLSVVRRAGESGLLTVEAILARQGPAGNS